MPWQGVNCRSTVDLYHGRILVLIAGLLSNVKCLSFFALLFFSFARLVIKALARAHPVLVHQQRADLVR